MPTEMILKIFELHSVRDLENVSLVCRYFKMIVDHDIIWKTRCNSCGLKYSSSRYPVRSKNNELFLPILGFNQHLNLSSNITIQLSVNIDKTVYVLILLLEKASKFQNKWLLYPTKFLIPTIDIEIVWQTHLLRPLIYQDDCLRLFHQIIDHSLLLDHTQQSFKEQSFLDTLHLYEKHFHEQYCTLPLNKISSCNSIDRYQYLIPIYSYWDETYFKFSSYPLNDYENPFSFSEVDLILDANWINSCKIFMNQIYFEMYRDFLNINPLKSIDLNSSVIKGLKKSYERFLYITAKYAPTKQYDLIHPTYAIDIIWHCHM
ncbi:unnamed protein product [Rotaria sordida]|uniref:F-box domain-containing protein n=2 Tax=Rotaria sordida TaxID=392033 RepID=A0A813ZSV8_9BILA|nr:unnamed protein product [Rotaria sordida]